MAWLCRHLSDASEQVIRRFDTLVCADAEVRRNLKSVIPLIDATKYRIGRITSLLNTSVDSTASLTCLSIELVVFTRATLCVGSLRQRRVCPSVCLLQPVLYQNGKSSVVISSPSDSSMISASGKV